MSSEYVNQPVPEHAARRSFLPFALLLSNAVMGVPVMILGASIGRDYGSSRFATVILLGCAVTVLIAAMAAYAGAKSRCSASLLANRAFGKMGAHVLNLAIAASLLGWFAVEMAFVGNLLTDGMRSTLDVEFPRIVGIFLASIAGGLVCLNGINWISRAPWLFMPFLSAILIAVFVGAVRSKGVATDYVPSFNALGSGVSAIVGGYIVGCLIMPDYSRFSKSSRAAIGATVVALGPVYGAVLGILAFAGVVTQSWTPEQIMRAFAFPSAVIMLLPLGLMQNGIMSLYSSSLATTTLLKTDRFKMVAIALASLGFALAAAGADRFFVQFLVTLGVVFPPAAALVICAGIFGGGSTDGEEGLPGMNWTNLALWAIGIALGIAAGWYQLTLTGLPTLDGFVVTLLLRVLIHLREQVGTTS